MHDHFRTPNLVLMKKKFSSGRVLVQISSNWLDEGTNSIMQSSFLTWSLIKWCLISICFVRKRSIVFLVSFIKLVLSHLIRTVLILVHQSLNYCFIQITCIQQLPVTVYSTSAVDNVKLSCFFLCHETSEIPIIW